MQAENIKVKQCSELTFKLLEVLQTYHRDIQFFVVGFLFLEMVEQLQYSVSNAFALIDNVRRKAKWYDIEGLRAVHLFVQSTFKR